MADLRPAPSAQAPARSLHLLDLPRDILNLIFARLLPCELFAPRFTCRSIASLPAVTAAERREAVIDCWKSLLSDVRSLSFLRCFCETLRMPKSCDLLPVVAGTGCLDLCKWVRDDRRIKLGPTDFDLRVAIRAAALSGAAARERILRQYLPHSVCVVCRVSRVVCVMVYADNTAFTQLIATQAVWRSRGGYLSS